MTIKIFLDTEFSCFKKPEIISVGLVADNGKEFYGETADFLQSASPWVIENVVPHLNVDKLGKSADDLGNAVTKWLSEFEEPITIVCDYDADIDMLLSLNLSLPKIFKKFENLNYLITRFAKSNQAINQFKDIKQTYSTVYKKYFTDNNVPNHHSLYDAKAMKEAWTSVSNKFGIIIQ